MPDLLESVVRFGRLLRRAGLDVHTGRLIDLTRALEVIDLASRRDVHHACRALLVHRQGDVEVFDRLFDAFWRASRLSPPDGPPAAAGADDPLRPAVPSIVAAAATESDDEGGESDGGRQRVWSDADAAARKDFALFTADEEAAARAAIDSLAWTPGARRTHRWTAGEGGAVDLRRALASSLRTGGEVLALPRRERRLRPRPLLLLCDVSGSMERYSRMLLHFAHAVAVRDRRLEAFLFSTRLTRITHDLRARRIDAAMAAVAQAVPDWSGGTRIGDALRELQQRWRRRVLHGGTVVLIISDGWDRGDPELLRDQMARLQRSCHRVVWLNPLIGTVDYAPLTRGLRAALPFVDDFLPVRTLTDLRELAVHLNALASTRERQSGRSRPAVRTPGATTRSWR